MKVKVTETIVDRSILDDAITKTESSVPNFSAPSAYLIMNEETAITVGEALCKNAYVNNPHLTDNNALGMYRGCKVLIDNSLEFGEVDVR